MQSGRTCVCEAVVCRAVLGPWLSHWTLRPFRLIIIAFGHNSAISAPDTRTGSSEGEEEVLPPASLPICDAWGIRVRGMARSSLLAPAHSRPLLAVNVFRLCGRCSPALCVLYRSWDFR